MPDPHMEHLKCFQDPPTDPSWLDVWNWQKWGFLGTMPLECDFSTLPDMEDQDACDLPKAEVISDLPIRRRYFRNISAKALSQMSKAAPSIEGIHLERWCYGRRKDDKNWDMHSALLGHQLPRSLEQFSFYE
ncbi:Fc.00g054870.m01.CDS01 [Cosmosporella sp. VM-42]